VIGKRNRDGMLTAEALRAGDREAYAITRLRRAHTVTLDYRPMPGPLHWYVTHTILEDNTVTERHVWYFATIDEARTQWRARVRKHTKE
jgi:hypothetical protein